MWSAADARADVSELRSKLAQAEKAIEQTAGTAAQLTAANEKLSGEVRDAQAQLNALRAENARLAQNGQAKQEAEQRAASLAATAAQLAAAQRDLAAARSEASRLNETVQALDRVARDAPDLPPAWCADPTVALARIEALRGPSG